MHNETNLYVPIRVTILTGMSTIMNNTKQMVFNTYFTNYGIKSGKRL